ncbi:MAG: hypothetical protein JNM00_05565 [Flavobacteriales bacterium]|nr:hypothetical protein [Flavobacteriales bacterium]
MNKCLIFLLFAIVASCGVSKQIEFEKLDYFSKLDSTNNALKDYFLVLNVPADTVILRNKISSFIQIEPMLNDSNLIIHSRWFLKEHGIKESPLFISGSSSYTDSIPLDVHNEDIVAVVYAYRSQKGEVIVRTYVYGE